MTNDLANIILAAAAWINRAQDRKLNFLIVQNRGLRETGADPPRMTNVHRRELDEAAFGFNSKGRESCESMVTVDTFRRYYRNFVVAKWTFPNRTGSSRPPLTVETIALVLPMAGENPGFDASGTFKIIPHRNH